MKWEYPRATNGPQVRVCPPTPVLKQQEAVVLPRKHRNESTSLITKAHAKALLIKVAHLDITAHVHLDQKNSTSHRSRIQKHKEVH